MIRLLQHLLDPDYLYAIDPGPLGRWGLVYVIWALVLLVGACVAMRWRARFPEGQRPPWSAVAAAASGFGVLFLGLRLLSPLMRCLPTYAHYLTIDVWTARVWPVSATLIAITALGVGVLSSRAWPRVVQRQVDALTGVLDQRDVPLSVWESTLLGGVHLLGLGGVWYLADRSPLCAIPSWLALSLLPLFASPRRVRFETLAPLLPMYVGTGMLWLAGRLDVDVHEYQGFPFPDPLSPWFSLPVLVMTSLGYTLWIQFRLVTARARTAVRERLLPVLIGVTVALWLAGTLVAHRTHGVTASDPYSYVQMAIDLAETGSPLHHFELAALARELDLPTWPTVHIGYQPPFVDNRSPTMWPIGWPLLMVPFYWFGGLNALYLAAPVMSALALVVIWRMANEVLREETRTVRWVVASLTCLLVATSPEGSERILVPMADASAQLFTVLTLWLLVRSHRDRPFLHVLLAGASFGMAYLIRHPQLPLGIAALIAVVFFSRSVPAMGYRYRLLLLLAFGCSAFLVAVPDLVYHKIVFGGWLHTESTEWFLVSVRNVGRSFFSVLQQGILRRDELGFIAPFAAYGGWRLFRKHRQPTYILTTGTLAVFVFHLCYAALRPRDLIAVLPMLYLGAAYGFVAVWRWGQARRTLFAALLLTCGATLLCARSHRVLAMPWRNDVITFGHVSARQLQALDTLHTVTEGDAVVGTMLNSGAIELHAGRQAVHPAPWTEEELVVWTDALLTRNRAFYILDDGEEMKVVLSRLRAHYVLEPIQMLDLPYFALGGGNLPQAAFLHKVMGRP